MVNWKEIEFPEAIALDKIIYSGQCFRPLQIDGIYRFITKDSVLYLKQVSARKLAFYINDVLYKEDAVSDKWDDFSLDFSSNTQKTRSLEGAEDTWKKIWLPYFDGKRKYKKIEKNSQGDLHLQKCIDFGKGLRILRQDPFETLITFILSQRKSIPAIRSSVEKLCEQFGEKCYSKVEEKEINRHGRVI